MSQLLIAILPILGTLAGGILTYFITSKIEARKLIQQIEAENRRWEREKSDRRQQHKREALEIILEWIKPTRDAVHQASSLLERYKKKEIDKITFISTYPDPTPSLKVLPPHYKAFLPEMLHSRIRFLQGVLLDAKYIATLDDYLLDMWKKDIDEMKQQVGTLEKEVEAEYRSTFD